MPVPLKVPNVGESITEVEIGEWLKQNGDFAAENDPVVVIETEKATVELPAPISGKVTEVIKKQGEKAAVGEVIGYMEEAAAPVKAAEPKSPPAPKQQPPAIAPTPPPQAPTAPPP